MHETQQHARPSSRGSTAVHARKGRRFSRKAIAAVLAAAVALVAVPAIAIANSFTVDYSWYKDATGSTYVIKTPGQWNAFANLVNGSADESQAGATVDSFKGKTVELGGDLNFFGQDVLPVGGQGGRTFDGAFDGKNHEIINVKIDAQGATANVGLIGAAGEGSSISNVKINKSVSLTIAATDNAKAVENVGVLVGSSKGSISNVSNAGTLTVSHTMDQTRDIVFPIKNVGGVAGICTGDVTGVSNSGAVSVSEPGVPYKADSADADWEDQSILAINIGGIVGSAGDVDSTVDKAADTAHGTISNCSNTGSVKVDTPKTNGLDRFGNTVYSQSSNVGGIAGYSRGSIDGCTNSGYLDAPHAAGMGGIVGGLRAKTTTTSYSGNFTQEGSDDGMAAGAGALAVTNCMNSGSVYGYSFPAGIVGRAGTHTQISGCINDSAATILGSRATKPFPAGIVGSSYGTVSYCGNLGTIVAGTWTGEGGTITQSGGYFASGIAGNLSSFTKNVDGEQQNASGTPELYGCYNAGAVKAMDNMRQRALVGDNGGYVHDNVAVAGLVYNDRLVYGMYADDTETSGGNVYNNVLLSADDFKANNAYDPAKQDNVSRYNPNTTNAIAVLNVNADKDGWGTYWTKSNGKVNGGNPALNSQVDWPATDLSAATVEFAANAQYTGLAATPKATVALNGKQLQQDTDFRVVPQDGAVEVTAADSKPYTAKVQGIGAYSGEAGSFAYGIDKGDLANCTVTFDTKVFNWTAQEPAATGVHAKNAAGKEIASSEYTFAFNQSDKNLSNIDASGNATTENTGKKGAVNAKKYAMVVTASADSEHFTGQASGTFSIKTAKIAWDKDAEKLKQNAYPTSVSYDGSIISFPKESDTANDIAWDSMTLRADLSPEHQNDDLLTVSYTGKSVKPAVNDVVYKGKSLTLGVDYRVVYGASLNEGQVVEAGKENLGKAGGEDFGYVTARYISGGNFSNYDNMKFKIVDQGAKLDIAKAQVKGTDDIVFEQGGVYTPVTVWYGGSQLTEGTDYTISYTDNNKPGTASFKIVGKGAYTGEKSGTFKLVEGTPYELQYAFNADGTATVTGVEYNGALDAFNLTIPETVEHNGKAYTVTAIGNKAFGGLASDFSGSKANESKGKIASVSVPATVKSLGTYAFGASTTGDASMAQLKSVAFAEGSQLASIGNFAFAKTGISEIAIPAGVVTVGENAFSGNNGTLKTVTFLSESGSMPTFATGVLTKSSFYGVYGVTAKAYDGTAAATFAQGMVSTNKWKFESMGSVPEKSQFTVSFNALGGTPVPEAQTVKKGEAAQKPATDPAKANSTFAGWFESSDGGKTLADSAYDFTTPVTADKVLYAKWEDADKGALVVEVQDVDGKVVETKSVSAFELKAMATTDGDPALGQYFKGGKWNVYRSTNYVTYSNLFANLGLSVSDYDEVTAWQGGSAGKFTGTLGQMKSGKWYPDAEASGQNVNLGEAKQSVPAGLALSCTSGNGTTLAQALAAAETAKLDTSKAPMQIMGAWEGATGGNRFWTNVDKIVVKKAPVALNVVVKDSSGTVEQTLEVTKAQLEEWATTNGDPALGQYFKGGKWNVYRSTNYVTYNDLFANLKLSVGAYDVVKACAADGSGKWSGTLSTMNSGAWYPNAESKGSTVNLGAAGQTLPAGLALSYTSGTGATPAAALAAAEAGDAKLDTGKAPLQLMGVCDNTVGGNRFWSNVVTVEVTRNAATALTVETQDAEGNVIASKDASYADLLKWKSDGEARGQYYKGGKWNVYRSTDFVTFTDLIANLELDVSGSDKLFFDKTSSKAWSGTLDAANAGKWYPDAESDSVLGEFDGTLPAGVMLTYAKGSGATVSEALEGAQEMGSGSGSGIVSIMGAWDGATGGNRFWSGLTKLVFQRQISIAKVEGDEGTFGYKQGDIAATVDAKLMSDLTDASYQWYSVDAAARARVAGTPIEGATSAIYELPAGKPAGTYTVYCVVSAKDAKGEAVSVTTDPVDLVVAKAPNSIAWSGEGFDASSNSVTVTAQANPATAADGEAAAAVQYAISSSASADASALAWQDSASFIGLDADTAYYVYAKVSGLPNHEDAVSEPLSVRTKIAGVLASPVLDPVTYDPTATLAGIKLPSGWKWADASTVPTVKCGAYDAVFTPTDEQLASTDYSKVDGWDQATKTVKRLVALTVNKATPVITAAPSATDLVFGQALGESSLTGGTASVAGTFAWDDPQRMPQVAESGVACMTVRFTPADADNYNAASVKVAVKVAPKNLAKDVATITAPGQIYTGAALEPALTVVYNGVTLAAGADYDVAYANNVEVGTASYTVTFKGNYTGTASGTFAISKAPAASVPSDQVTGPTTGSTGAVAAPQAGAAPAAGNATALAPTGDGVLGGIVAAVCAIVAAAIGVAFARRRMSR